MKVTTTAPTTGLTDDECAPRARRGEQVGVVVDGHMAEKHDVMVQTDKCSKPDRPEARDDADDEGEHRQTSEADAQAFILLGLWPPGCSRRAAGQPVDSMDSAGLVIADHLRGFNTSQVEGTRIRTLLS